MYQPTQEVLDLCAAVNKLEVRWNELNKRLSKSGKNRETDRSAIYNEMNTVHAERFKLHFEVKSAVPAEWWEYECPIELCIWFRNQFYKSWKYWLVAGVEGEIVLTKLNMETLDAKYFVPRYLADKNIKADAPLRLAVEKYIADGGKIGPQ